MQQKRDNTSDDEETDEELSGLLEHLVSSGSLTVVELPTRQPGRSGSGDYAPDTAPTSTTLYLLGTSHVSAESAEEARTLIRGVRPEYVCVELCSGRKQLLHCELPTHVPTFQEMLQQYRSRSTPLWGILYTYALAQVAATMKVPPGADMRAAAQEAEAIGAKVVLADRPVQVTLKRTWAALSAWERLRLLQECLCLGSVSQEEVERFQDLMKDSDALTEGVRELGRAFPNVLEPLIHERDRYLVHCLRRTTSSSPPPRAVVAVVGRGHIGGILANWHDTSIDHRELLRVPHPRGANQACRDYLLHHRWTLAVAAAALAAASGIVVWRRWR